MVWGFLEGTMLYCYCSLIFFMITTLLLKGGIVVTSLNQFKADVLIRNGIIVKIAPNLAVTGGKVIDCANFFILPGLIDPHVHLRTPGSEYKEDWTTGTKAAAAGGITTILDMPNTLPPITSQDLLDEKREMISGKAFVNYGLYMGATIFADGKINVDEYLKSDAVALKVYMGSSTGNLLVDQTEWLEEIFAQAGKADKLICVHAEDESLMKQNLAQLKLDDPGLENKNDPTLHSKIRDNKVAYSAIKHALHLAKKHGTRLHICHLSTQLELEEFVKFKNGRISCEVSPHHLFLDESELGRQGNFAKMNPPLRTSEDCKALMEGIKSGLVDCVATDHAPHTIQEKQQNYWLAPSGVPGLETSLPLLLDAVNRGELNLEDVVKVMYEGPARIFRLREDALAESFREGTKANLVVVNMNLEQKVGNGSFGARYTKCGWSVFSGRLLKGWPVMTIVNGEVVMERGVIVGSSQGVEIEKCFRF
ncbi:TPA: dihydroorotase [Candidatus Peregrinibacteria bacterium]|nr:dihydroorotase [Candidatus Peregrinibacteria bacterium]